MYEGLSKRAGPERFGSLGNTCVGKMPKRQWAGGNLSMRIPTRFHHNQKWALTHRCLPSTQKVFVEQSVGAAQNGPQKSCGPATNSPGKVLWVTAPLSFTWLPTTFSSGERVSPSTRPDQGDHSPQAIEAGPHPVAASSLACRESRSRWRTQAARARSGPTFFFQAMPSCVWRTRLPSGRDAPRFATDKALRQGAPTSHLKRNLLAEAFCRKTLLPNVVFTEST